MSRSAAIFFLADGTQLYGIWNNTVDQMFAVADPSAVNRDEAWDQWNNLEWPKMCTCTTEKCIVATDQYYVYAGNVFVGNVCRTHGLFHGPYSLEQSDGEGVADFVRTVRYWKDPDLQYQEYVRRMRIAIPRVFEPLLQRLMLEITKGAEPPAPLDEMVVWEE